ncbi:MAG: transcriptional activator FtrA [Lentisphaerae bacterium ADurb.Bin242]|nr:MAG: transcriptional activator FtrA [Lentisphaerae bacterium ADurb.Bin242]
MSVIPESMKRCTGSVFLGGKPEEKLSGGFYDQNYLVLNTLARKFDEYFALTYLLEGNAEYTDYLGRQFKAVPGVILIRHAGTGYQLRMHPDERKHWLEFSTALPESFYRSLRAVGILRPDKTFLNPGVSDHLLNLAGQYVSNLYACDTPAGLASAYAVILEFLSAAMRLSDEREGTAGPVNAEMLHRARELLSTCPDKPLNLRDAAGKLGIGYESFRKLFTAACGVSPHRYRILKKMDAADSLLLHTRLSVKQIASMLGYSAASSFTRQYTALRKRPPGSLRRSASG